MVKRGGKEENSEDFLDPETPFGEKKRLSSQMVKQYSPTAVEKLWYAWWEKFGFFVADAKSSKPPFVIVLPPPNVTGALHIGHALTAAVEDTTIRWWRMSGYNTLWVPGMDHVGIATQCFTMDEKRSRAVTEAFVRLYKEKLVYRGAKGNEMRLGICSRTNDVVEPLSKPQWYVKCNSMARQALTNDVAEPLSKPQCYVKCNSMARQALDAVEDKKIEIIPKQWLENIRDWCVSRQLWWGHRVPAWYVTLEDDELKELGAYNDRDHWVIARNEDEAQEEASRKYNGKKFLLSQDPDMLDTWFSSGLFPLTVLGWPDDTEDLKAFYPTSVLETGHDILFFWVARLVMLGMKLGGESGDVPFRKVYLHPMIRDAHGRKIFKSLGNVIDPLEVIDGISLEGLHKMLVEGNLDPKELTVAKEGQVKDFPNGIPECGTDALRFALISYTAQSDKINLDIQRVVGYHQWCNKLWNAVRFAISKFGNDYVLPANVNPDKLPFSCQWILSLLSKAISKTVTALELYELSDAASTVYSWWQYQLCDVFIEAIKPFFAGNDSEFESARSSA
ncbi:valine--trna ligase [Quercus suber]|uniref:valine--tRNA ligase n=1 Tax=Quercus suber TaxID=58331 RepID=A0AAW0KPA9_QUESU